MINVCNEYGEPMLYGNRKKRTQPQKLPIVNTVATERQYICPDFSDFRWTGSPYHRLTQSILELPCQKCKFVCNIINDILRKRAS
jgi:hypothetical protein